MKVCKQKGLAGDCIHRLNSLSNQNVVTVTFVPNLPSGLIK